MTASSVPGLVTLSGRSFQLGCVAMMRSINMPKSARFFGPSIPSPRRLHSIHATPFSGVAFLGRSSLRLYTIV